MNLKQEQSFETRKKLLECAKKLFAHKGYAGTTVKNIKNETGMADSLLYYYFPGGKKELLEVLVKESIDEAMSKFDIYNNGLENMPLEKALECIYISNNEAFDNNLDLLYILLREVDILDAGQLDFITDMTIKRRQWIAGFLVRRYEKGEIIEMDFDIAAQQIFTASIAAAIEKIGNKGQNPENPEELDKLINFHLRLWQKEKQDDKN